MQDDKYQIDSHKLIYHPKRVADWLSSRNIFPIYMEISPTGMCNLRCVFCSVDFMGYQNRSLPTGPIKERLTELGQLGIKSVMYAGEGEPFIHKDMSSIIRHTAESGIDVAVTSNGILMTPDVSEKILRYAKWIKISCNAGTPGTYAAIHRSKPDNFNKVLDNLRCAVKIRKRYGYSCTLGIQILLLPENEHEVEQLVLHAKDIGLDYIVVKPYTHHYRNAHEFDVGYKRNYKMSENLKIFNDDNFKVIFRVKTMQKWDEKKRRYNHCFALPFWSYIDAGGNVWGCSSHLEDGKFLYGNIMEKSFKEIWEGNKRAESLKWVNDNLDVSNCKLNCRMDEINNYLSRLKSPGEHVNFI